ncbi:PREDICTED: serine protease inhibitor 3/4-like isoform X2 [Habropoda laboriosa]|uniref:serine protease inhibitor 3/4-like isoform X2 n=1 Tax=Habropoda laboriosa TaxID=597456 RepID=UPI00083CD371|nr:PREDICTED: serine protease inhibitor 3/4-like isoform X2 [Habropoda laboriosa]
MLQVLIKGSLLLAACILILITMAKANDNTQALRAVSESTNQFSSSFFKSVAEEKSDNLIMSPLSAAVVLAMAAYGARGETENQFRKLLHLPSPDSFGTSGYQMLIDNLNNVEENKLVLANKVFSAEQFGIKRSYKDLTENYFRSVTQLVNFSKSEEAANIINTWVEQTTNNLIKNLISPGDVDSTTSLVLVNAVYFKGQWKNKFNPRLTHDMPFHINKNTVKNIPTMYRQGTYNYGEIPDMNAKFIEIPYKGDELSIVIILPNEIDGLAAVEKKLENSSISEILRHGFSRDVNLYLPKFKVESTIPLNSILQKMGLTDAFTTRANFSGIADARLLISKVIQKAFIEVNEEGSEAAAATGLVILKKCEVTAVDITVTHPFLYHIIKSVNDTKNRTSSIVSLFSGHVIEPKI